jgi:hypothetical protein
MKNFFNHFVDFFLTCDEEYFELFTQLQFLDSLKVFCER